MSVPTLLTLALALGWCLIVGRFTGGEALAGLAVGALLARLSGIGRGLRIPLRELQRRLFYLGVYIVLVLGVEIVRSNLDLARRLLRPRPALRPGIVRIRIGVVPPHVAALMAHTITLAPGQMIVDFSEDGDTMYAHVVDLAKVPGQIASFWRIYAAVLRRIFG